MKKSLENPDLDLIFWVNLELDCTALLSKAVSATIYDGFSSH